MIAGRKSQPLILIDEFKRSNGAAVELPSKGFGSNSAGRPNAAAEITKKDKKEKTNSIGVNQQIQKIGDEVEKAALGDEDEEEEFENDLEDEDEMASDKKKL